VAGLAFSANYNIIILTYLSYYVGLCCVMFVSKFDVTRQRTEMRTNIILANRMKIKIVIIF